MVLQYVPLAAIHFPPLSQQQLLHWFRPPALGGGDFLCIHRPLSFPTLFTSRILIKQHKATKKPGNHARPRTPYESPQIRAAMPRRPRIMDLMIFRLMAGWVFSQCSLSSLPRSGANLFRESSCNRSQSDDAGEGFPALSRWCYGGTRAA